MAPNIIFIMHIVLWKPLEFVLLRENIATDNHDQYYDEHPVSKLTKLLQKFFIGWN